MSTKNPHLQHVVEASDVLVAAIDKWGDEIMERDNTAVEDAFLKAVYALEDALKALKKEAA